MELFYLTTLSCMHEFAEGEEERRTSTELFSDLKPEMEKLVPKLRAKNYPKLVKVAKKFFKSSLAKKIHGNFDASVLFGKSVKEFPQSPFVHCKELESALVNVLNEKGRFD